MNEIYWYNCIGKSKKHKGNLWMIAVVPRAGTWIETSRIPPSYSADPVVPLVETCIETSNEEVRLGVTVESYFLICSKSFFKRVAAVNRSRTMQS